MKDILAELASEIKKSQDNPQPVNHRHQVHQFYTNPNRKVVSHRESKPAGNFIKARGPGGMIMDFGNRTGNPFADRATDLLNQFPDPVQAAIVGDQAKAFDRAIMEHVTGKSMITEDDQRSSVVAGLCHDEWNKQLGKSFDKQTAEHVAKSGLGGGGDAMFVEGEFNSSQLAVGSDVAIAQSPTDAAVIEMMKREMAKGD